MLSAINDRDVNTADWLLKLGADFNAHLICLYVVESCCQKRRHRHDANQQANYGSGEKIPVGNLSLAVNYVKNPVPIVCLLFEAGIKYNATDDPFALKGATEKGNIEPVDLNYNNGNSIQKIIHMSFVSRVNVIIYDDQNKALVPFQLITFNTSSQLLVSRNNV